MAITKERKQELVEQYTDMLQRSRAVILTNYQGLNVTQITQLRSQIRQADGAYHVTKNTLIQLAAERADMSMPDEWLDGPTAIGFCFQDVPPVAKAITDFIKESEILTIKGGLLGERAIDEAQVKALADLPPLEVLRGQVLGALTGPMSGVVGVLNGALAGLVGVLDARHNQMSEAEAAS